MELSTAIYDVAIVGAGVVGCALAYALSQYRLRIILIDKNHDVGEGTSKANSAIIHTGFDATPGSLESLLVTRASRRWPELAQKLKIPFVATSAMLMAVSDEQAAELPALRQRALDNGVDDVELVSAARARALEPAISPDVRGALLVPRESIADPFAAPIAYAEVALANGVDMLLGAAVSAVTHEGTGIKQVVCDRAEVRARIVVNAAGLGSRALAGAYDGAPFDINPRRGQFVVYDRHAGSLVSRILLPIPTKRTKGMLVAPTIFGNLLAGPTAEDLPADAVDDTRTTVEGLRQVKESALALCPALAEQPVIAVYAGLRCNCAQGSYWIRYNDGHPGMVTVSGIRSTGLTASLALAEHLMAGLAAECALVLEPDPSRVDSRPQSSWPGWWRRPYDQEAEVRACPGYGEIVCSCEQISRGEIVDALRSPLGPHTLDALKRRTRVLTGRCQGFQCGVPVARLIHEHCGIPLHRVSKRGPGSELAVGPVHGGDDSAGAGTPAAEDAPAAGDAAGDEPAKVGAPAVSGPRSAHYRVAVIGAGPAGIGVALGLARRGIEPVLVIERGSEPGGVPARYKAKDGGVPTFVMWSRGRVVFGSDYADELTERLAATATELWLSTQVVALSRADRTLTAIRPGVGKVRVTADAVVLCCGAREQTIAERGWIAGQRPARVFPTMQLLDLLDGHGILPMRRPLVIGSDLIGFAAAAKLGAGGAEHAVILDWRRRPATGYPGRRYFARWARPRWRGRAVAAEITGSLTVEAVTEYGEYGEYGEAGAGGVSMPCDGVVVSGELIPNSELAVDAGLGVELPARLPVLHRGVRFSEAGFFAAGNIIGGFHGAQWCYVHGKKAARAVAAYLRALPAAAPLGLPARAGGPRSPTV